MSTKEVGYIRNLLKQDGPTRPPHYTDEGYQAGEYVEGGFEVADKPEKPEHTVIHVGPQYVIDNSDMDSRIHEAESHTPAEVIHVGNRVRYVMAGEDTEADRRAKKADAAAQAVRDAIMRGEIDPSLFTD